uniref:E1A-binding protein p400 n=1 Tax=Pavo cristatus TaxID=9049 RepID=A0A8C9F6Z6_PAVCR
MFFHVVTEEFQLQTTFALPEFLFLCVSSAYSVKTKPKHRILLRMHHGNGPQNAQRQLQRSRSFTGSEGEEQQANLPQSPAASFAPSASPSAPQSPSYQIQQFIMSRSPVAGQNVNITLQNVGPVASGNQQITLTPLPIPNPTSPSFQFSPQQRRFEHGSPSYIQVTSPLPQQVQSQSPTQPSPVPVQTLPNVRAGTPGPGLGMCSQSPTRGFVDASVLVRQISLSPSNGGHFVYQEGPGIAQIAQGAAAQVQLPSSGTPATVRERRLSQPHSQSGGTIHHLGPQSPVASGANMQSLTSPGHITTTSLPPQISNIIQGQLMQQQQQVLQGQQLSRPIGYDRASGGLIAGVGGPGAFGMTSPPPPTSPSRATVPQGLSSLPLTPTVNTAVKKQPKKLEEIPPANQETAQMRKQCLDHHHKQMEILKETFKECLIELFFLQHLQGNMMDFLAFKKKHCVPLQAYLRQNDLDLEEEEEEEQSEVINDEQTHTGTPVTGAVNTIEMEAFKRQQTLAPAGGMPPTPQTVQLTGQKQSQQQYDPSKGPPVQNAASLHTPPPQLPGRLQPVNVPMTSLPAALQITQQQPQIVESPTQPQIQVKIQPQSVPLTSAPLPAPLQQQVPPAIHVQGQTPNQASQPQAVTLTRPSADPVQTSQRLTANILPPTSAVAPAAISGTAPPSTYPVQTNRTSPATNKSLSPIASKPPGLAVAAAPKTQSPAQNAAVLPQDNSQDKLAEQVKLENQIHQRIAELRKEGLWSLRRLPKLQEAPRPKSHWDYLLEEMQWMATDFAQERKWKMATAKKMVRTVARYHEEKKLNEERAKREEQNKLRRIAASIAREIEYFWSNIEQVKYPLTGLSVGYTLTFVLILVEDEEETIEEQEAKEGNINHQTELSNLVKEGKRAASLFPLESSMTTGENMPYSKYFLQPSLTKETYEEKNRLLKERLDRIFSGNERRCSRAPVYGSDLLSICSLTGERRPSQVSSCGDSSWRWAGFVNCCLSSASGGPSDPLREMIQTLVREQESLKDVVGRALFVLPAAVAAPPCLYVANPPPSYSHRLKVLKHSLKQKAAPHLHQLQRITTPQLLQFPDLRLVQYDSGKLEALAVLLLKLKSEGRRVLILSQMILMLDILELFLNFHFLTFVRIDEYANHEQRQELMKSFNRDKRIFCAILSSHSRSTGVNLVEADTVVFYDNDLNPVMDAKAQEWCDRIGRCKDIHIYRLVSRNSVEEKLLKNGTKDLIREVAAQGNDYSMAFLTQLPDNASFCCAVLPENMTENTEKKRDNFPEVIDSTQFIRSLETNFIQTKKAWEVQHLRELKEKEQKMLWEDEEELLTYTREDAYNKEYVYEGPDGQTEIMPLWTPPTPPQDDNDIYIDSVMCLMYDTTPIPESKLPPVYVRKERKRHKTDPSAAGRKKKQRHGETVIPPRSLFDRATPGMLKMRREGKEQKKNILLKQQTQFAKPLPTLVKPAAETGQDNPEWLISEDWALLQAVKQLLELPLNLAVVSPAHTPNWDLVSDVVNSCSRVYRSPKQCRNRYENVIIPREEGKTKNSRPLRTNQIYAQDEGATHTQLYTNHFEMMKMIAGKRSPPIKPLLGMNPFQKNPKHASVLAESGINYDKPLPPIQVASLRAERIAKEKKALAEQQRAQQQAGPQSQQQQAGQQQAQQPAVQQAQAQPQPQAQAQVVQQPQAVVQTAVTTVANTAVLAGTIKTAVTGTSIQTATVSGNVIVNTVAGVPAATFQPINKRLASPVIPGTLTVSRLYQKFHSLLTARVSCDSTVLNSTPTVQLSGKTITPAHFQLLRQQQQQAAQVQVPQIQAQAQAQSPAQIKTVGKLSQEQLIKLQKQKLQLPQQQAAQQTQQGAQQQAAQVQVQQQQQTQQLTAVTAPRPGAVLTGTTVTNLQVARLTRVPASQLQAQGQIQAQTPQAAQVALAKPPVVSVPAAVVSSAGVTTLPVTVAGISVAIGQPQKAAGMSVHLLKHNSFKFCFHKGRINAQQVTVQTQQQTSQQQKVTYTTQPAIKTQFLTTPISQTQKPGGTQQVQAQIQVQVTPFHASKHYSQPQTVTLSQTTAGQQQVQVIPATTATAQVVQQKLIQQQVVTTASPQIQAPGVQNPAQTPATSEAQNQQAKVQMRTPTVRLKAPTKPS